MERIFIYRSYSFIDIGLNGSPPETRPTGVQTRSLQNKASRVLAAYPIATFRQCASDFDVTRIFHP